MDTSLLRYRACSIVLTVRRKTSKPTERSRNSVSEFQTIGPAIEKARWPNVIRRQRGTVSWCWLTERMSAADSGDRNVVVAQIRRSFVLQTPANHNNKLVLDSLGDVKPVLYGELVRI